MEKRKKALVTGGTGGIGMAFAELLSDYGYEVFLPVRSLETDEAKALAKIKHTHLALCDVGNQEAVSQYLGSLLKEISTLDLVVLAAGTFKWDKSFPGETQMEKEQNAIEFLTKANLTTKETVIYALEKSPQSIAEAKIIIISSHAACFEVGHPWRPGEEGYVQAMAKVSLFAETLQTRFLFKEVILDEPGLIDTPMARKEFTKETIGEDPDWDKVPKPLEYAAQVLTKNNLI